MPPITSILASTIAQLAFSEFIKSGSSELAKQSLDRGLDLIKELRQKIAARFQGRKHPETLLKSIEKHGTRDDLEKIGKYLDIEMLEDESFSTEIRQIAQQIISIQHQDSSTRAYQNYGRDQINVESIHGNPKIGGS